MSVIDGAALFQFGQNLNPGQSLDEIIEKCHLNNTITDQVVIFYSDIYFNLDQVHFCRAFIIVYIFINNIIFTEYSWNRIGIHSICDMSSEN